MKEIKKFFICLLFRFICFLVTDTWFVPDEYFQCTEVAYGMVYNKSHLTWEWKRDPPLRSIVHPLMVSWLYRLYKFVGGDTTLIIRVLPNLLHSYFFALGDVFYIMLCERIFFANPRGYTITLILYFTNWFIIYCSSRSLANSLECVLIIIALYWYPFYPDEVAPDTPMAHRRQKTFIPYMILGTLSIIIRPTAILIWGILGLYHLFRSNERWTLIRIAMTACLSPLMLSIALDSNFRLPIKFPLLSFAQFNFFSDGSAHFGVHPWYWYFIDGLFLTTSGMYLTSIAGYLYQIEKKLPRSPPKILFLAAAFYMLVHSCLPHKEHRFVLPIIPLLLPFAGLFLQYAFTKAQRWTQTIILFYVVINVVAAVFFCKFHQRGVLDATKDIAEDISLRRSSNAVVHIVQLTPCYSMPQYAYFHHLPVEHHMLDCTPNLAKKPKFIDESDLFHADPVKFLYKPENYEKYLLHRHSYIIIYKKTYQKVSSILKETGYRIWRKYSHTIMPSSTNQDTVLFVLKRSSNALMK